MGQQSTWIKWLVPVGIVAAIIATIEAGTPDPLPGVALGSEFLFHAERGAVLFWGWVLVLGVLFKGLQGELPVEFSTTGGRYREVASGTLAELNDRVDDQATFITGSVVPKIVELERRLDEIGG